MFGMFWIALELGNSKMGLKVILSLLVKKLSAFENDEVAKSGNTGEIISDKLILFSSG